MSFQAPLVRELTRTAIEGVLRRNNVGRIAYVLEQRVEVEPVHFAFSGDWIYGRTAQGATLRTVHYDRAVTFHVDEIDGVLSWRSILIRGPVTVLPLDCTSHEREEWEEGLAALQRLDSPRMPDDSDAERGSAFRILLDEVSGRCCGDASARARDTELAANRWPSRHRASPGWSPNLLDARS